MKKYILGISVIAAATVLPACSDYLDMTPTDRVSDKGVWASITTAEYAVNNMYTYIEDVCGNQSVAGMVEGLTDEMKYGSYLYMSNCFIPSEIAYGGSTLNSTYVDAYMGFWGSLYNKIRRVNEGLYYLAKYGKLSDEETTRLNAEMRTIRGILYFELAKRYKDVVLYDEDLTKIAIDQALTPENEVWDFIEKDLKCGGEILPDAANAKGRVNKGMAWGFLSRAMLYAERWSSAYEAALEVEKLGYTLEANYADATAKEISKGNKEAIFQTVFDQAKNVTHEFDFYYTPGGDYTLFGQTAGGYGTPTQEMVECYELAEGGLPDWTPWHAEGVTDTPPYADLEPRFQATILYNGADWKGRVIESFVGGGDGFCVWNKEQDPKGRTTTGYYLRKLVDESHDVIAVKPSTQPKTRLRLAEVLLNKAEACYRLGDATGANAAIKAIRERVNLPYSDKSGDALWKAIMQERRVELAYEGLRYWDLRRWKMAAEQYPTGLNGYQVHGMRIEQQANGDFVYNYVAVDDRDRNFPERMYRFPLPVDELNANSLVEQYPEWK